MKYTQRNELYIATECYGVTCSLVCVIIMLYCQPVDLMHYR